jgi:glycosyltransferase involved in cell wall biosynthesis
VRASLLIPTLNEGESIAHVLRTFREASERANSGIFASDPVHWEVIVIDGASTDETVARARAEGAQAIVEPRKGYGRAYLTGFARSSGEYLATLDGDATYPAERVPELLRYLIDQELDFLSGDRLAELDPQAMTMEHRIGNGLLNLLLRVAFHRFLRPVAGHSIRDSQSGMWVFRRRLLERLELTQEGMAFSEELKLEVVIRGFRFEEVPVRYAERWGRPKLSTWRDGRRNFSYLLTKRLALEKELRARARREAMRAHPSAP